MPDILVFAILFGLGWIAGRIILHAYINHQKKKW